MFGQHLCDLANIFCIAICVNCIEDIVESSLKKKKEVLDLCLSIFFLGDSEHDTDFSKRPIEIHLADIVQPIVLFTIGQNILYVLDTTLTMAMSFLRNPSLKVFIILLLSSVSFFFTIYLAVS